MNKTFQILCMIGVIFAGAWPGSSKEVVLVPGPLSSVFSPPILPAAKPLPGGKLRLAVLTPRPVPEQIQELASRIEAEIWNNGQELSGLEISTLASALSEADVLVVAGLPLSGLSPALRDGILALVAEGKGLVSVTCGAPEDTLLEGFTRTDQAASDLVERVPWSLLSAFANAEPQEPSVSCFESKGRIVTIAYPSGENRSQPFCPSTAWSPNVAEWEADQVFSFLCRSIVWASGSPQEAVIQSMGSEGNEWVVKGTWNEHSIVQARARSLDGRDIASWKVSGKDAVRLPLSDVPSGSFVLETSLSSGQGVHDWRSARLEIPGSFRITGTQAGWVGKDAGQEFQILVSFEGEAKEGWRLRTWAVDALSKEVARSEVILPASVIGEIRCVLPYWPARVSRHTLCTEMRDAQGTCLSFVSQQIFVPVEPPPGFFAILSADLTHEFPDRKLGQSLSKQNVSGVLLPFMEREPEERWRARLEAVTQAGLRPCLRVRPGYDQSFRAFGYEILSADPDGTGRLVTVASGYHPLFYLIEEPGLQGEFSLPLLNDQTLVAFRDFLRSKYGSLQGLRSAWDREFRSWDLVPPVEEMASHYAMLRDVQSFFEEGHRAAYKRTVDQIRKIDPSAWVLLSLPDGFDRIPGVDWPGIAEQMDGAVAGSGLEDGVSLESMPFRQDVLGMSLGKEESCWDAVSRGARFAVFKDPMNLPAGLAQLGNGLGQVFDITRFSHDGVLIYASPESLIRSMADRQMEAFSLSHAAALRMVEGMGMRSRILRKRELLKGGTSEAWLIVMPHTSILSVEEAGSLMTFCQSGGIVLADLLPGTEQSVAGRESSRIISKLFGVIPSTGQDPSSPETAQPAEKKEEQSPWQALEAETVSLGSGGRLLFQRSLGRGSAILLDRPFHALTQDGQEGGKGTWGERLRPLFSVPRMRLDPMDSYETSRVFTYTGRGRDWVGVSPTEDLVLHWTRPVFLYDVMKSEAVGFRNSIALSRGVPDEGPCDLFCLSSSRTTGMSLKGPGTLQLGAWGSWEARLEMDPAGGESEGPFVSVRLRPPRGSDWLEEDYGFVGEDGTLKGRIFMPSHAPKGTWILGVRDRVSGKAHSVRFKVRG